MKKYSISAKLMARSLKAKLLVFRESEKPIIVIGLRRGGSTMVAETIGANRGVWLANEPFAVFPAHPAFELKKARLPHREHSQFFCLSNEEQEKFSRYVRDLLSARPSELGSCRSPKMLLRSDRVCLKVLNAPWMIDWFSKETDAHILPLIRHPGAQALSVLRQKWDFSVRAYANRMESIGSHFTSGQRKLILDVIAEEDRWRLAILDYAVSTLIIFKTHRQDVVRYEDIVAAPETFVDGTLIGKLGLSQRERMLDTLNRPSGSSRMSLENVNSAIQLRDTATILNSWRAHVSADMKRVGQRILDEFAIDAYSFLEGEGGA